MWVIERFSPRLPSSPGAVASWEFLRGGKVLRGAALWGRLRRGAAARSPTGVSGSYKTNPLPRGVVRRGRGQQTRHEVRGGRVLRRSTPGPARGRGKDISYGCAVADRIVKHGSKPVRNSGPYGACFPSAFIGGRISCCGLELTGWRASSQSMRGGEDLGGGVAAPDEVAVAVVGDVALGLAVPHERFVGAADRVQGDLGRGDVGHDVAVAGDHQGRRGDTGQGLDVVGPPVGRDEVAELEVGVELLEGRRGRCPPGCSRRTARRWSGRRSPRCSKIVDLVEAGEARRTSGTARAGRG